MNSATTSQEPKINPDDFTITNLEDEIRVDGLCQGLLKHFHQYLLQTCNTNPQEAGAQAGGADFFLRDFVVDGLRRNIFQISATQVGGFAGNWYIHRTLEPNMKELESVLRGVASFYRFCAANNWVDPTIAAEIERTCADLDYYQQRINSFHDLAGDDYPAWCEECPL